MPTSTSSSSSSEILKKDAAHESRATARRTRRAIARWGGWLAVLALVAGLLVVSLRQPPIAVEVARAERGDLTVAVEELAKTRVRDRYVVSAPTPGSLLRIELRAGDPVTGGATLATIVPMVPALLDPRARAEAEARYRAAAAAERQAHAATQRADLAREHATHDLESARSLVKSGSLPDERLTEAELDSRMRNEESTSARFAEQMAANDAAMAAAALKRFGDASGGAAMPLAERFDVTSPIAGQVLRVLRESAGVVQPGTPLLELGDRARLEVVADLLTADAVRLRPGAKVSVDRWGGPPLAARLRTIEPAAVTRISALGVEEQRVTVVVDLEEAPAQWAALGDGYRVEVRIVVEEKKGVVTIPLGATFRHGQGWAVYVIDGQVARVRPVTLGARSESAVEVMSGLVAGDRVIVHPSERVADGVRVEAR